MIGTEPTLRGRKLEAYRKGWQEGYDKARSDLSGKVTEANLEAKEHMLAAAADRRRAEGLSHRVMAADKAVVVIGDRVLELERDLQFANDRIEQLMNSVVIIRDKK